MIHIHELYNEDLTRLLPHQRFLEPLWLASLTARRMEMKKPIGGIWSTMGTVLTLITSILMIRMAYEYEHQALPQYRAFLYIGAIELNSLVGIAFFLIQKRRDNE